VPQHDSTLKKIEANGGAVLPDGKQHMIFQKNAFYLILIGLKKVVISF